MDLYPAIDILDGACVRLYRGDYDQETVYGQSPADQAELFVSEGAKWIHVVDLDAARSGEATNTAAIAELIERVNEVSSTRPVSVQVGGGVRTKQDALRLFDLGVSRVVIGTAAIKNPELVIELAKDHRVAVGLDAWGSDICVEGWVERSGIDLHETIKSFEKAGIEAFIITEIERDGTLNGPDVSGLQQVLASTSVPVIASGGVADLSDIEALAKLEAEPSSATGVTKAKKVRELSGAIVGRAIYEKRFNVKEAIETIRNQRRIRVIPCLDVDGGRVVKGINFVGLRDAGDPVELAAHYDREGADEIVFLDITATSEKRETTVEMAARAAKGLGVSLTVGGGIRSVENVERLLEVGVGKVSVGSAAVSRPQLINDIVERFGSHILVVAIDAKVNADLPSGYEVYVGGGREATGLDCVLWAKEVARRGAGEILLTSMDTDGTETGFDNELNRSVTDAVDICVVASGGVGNLEHLVEGVTVGGVDAVLAASIFHFGQYSIAEAKAHLAKANLRVY